MLVFTQFTQLLLIILIHYFSITPQDYVNTVSVLRQLRSIFPVLDQFVDWVLDYGHCSLLLLRVESIQLLHSTAAVFQLVIYLEIVVRLTWT